MGQVPQAVYGIVGDGRLARHLAHYFNLLRIPHRQWSRRIEREQGTRAREILGNSETLLVAISDSAIVPWIEQYKASAAKPQRFVHFSGALVTDLALGFHPLMTFGTSYYDLSDYERIPFVGEEGAPSFRDVFPKAANPTFAIPRERKALYHALCVMSGNFTVLLWQKFFDDLEKLGLPLSAALPYLERTAKNLKTDPKAALTGPLARGDRQTIQKNLDSLAGDRFQKVYQSFVEAHLA